MCTVVIRVPEAGGPARVRILAVRDEDPARPWLPLGQWWPEQPNVRGIKDELAGGAWLAHDDNRLAVLLNRAGGATVATPTSRGALVLGSLKRTPIPQPITTLGFNLIEAIEDHVRVTSFDGDGPRVTDLQPGTHMIAHSDVDDWNSPRIATWLPAFSDAPTEGLRWWSQWLQILRRTTEQVPPTDDRAIIRDNRPHGYPTQSLLVAVASVGHDGIYSSMATLNEPGRWSELNLSA